MYLDANPSRRPALGTVYMGVSQNYGYLFGGHYNKDYRFLGSTLRSPSLFKGKYRIYLQAGVPARPLGQNDGVPQEHFVVPNLECRSSPKH